MGVSSWSQVLFFGGGGGNYKKKLMWLIGTAILIGDEVMGVGTRAVSPFSPPGREISRSRTKHQAKN